MPFKKFYSGQSVLTCCLCEWTSEIIHQILSPRLVCLCPNSHSPAQMKLPLYRNLSRFPSSEPNQCLYSPKIVKIYSEMF